MAEYEHTQSEKDLNKILKLNQDSSTAIFKNEEKQNEVLDQSISSSEELLQSLGFALPEKQKVQGRTITELANGAPHKDFNVILSEANSKYSHDISFDDLLTQKDFSEAFTRLDEINEEFSRKTSIVNKTDIIFLGIAIALQTAKSLLFGQIAKQFDYGNSFDPDDRLPHNDESIEKEHRRANDEFKEKHEKQGHGYWMNILYQTPPFDITRGSPDIGRKMEGGYHRVHTLGHDPVLGWIFGTMNILTDTITFEDFQTNRVIRTDPVTKAKKMKITPERVFIGTLVQESIEMIKADTLNLPAAVFAEAQHLKSDEFTKLGLPVPILETINSEFASKLYKSNYDALCFSRDMKIVSVSATISLLFDMIIGLVHALFNKERIDKELYEVRTRKILLVSNSIAASSNIIQTYITKNPKNLDIGSLLVTVSHLFSDLRFISRVKEEFVRSELDKDLKKELQFLGI